jgi:hypothetical protein
MYCSQAFDPTKTDRRVFCSDACRRAHYRYLERVGQGNRTCGICGLPHSESSHGKADDTFTGPNRCEECVELRCNVPAYCANRLRRESVREYRQRLQEAE